MNVTLARLSTLLLFCVATTAAAETHPVHAIAMHGSPKYPADFSHFEYANPDAPKGGSVRLEATGSFDSFNQFIVKGVPAAGSGLLFDTLLENSADEPFTMYGLLAESIEVPEDRSWVIFRLRREARFRDGTPVTAADVIFTFRTLLEKGKPFYRAYYADIESVEGIDEHTVRFHFSPNVNHELALIVGQIPILSEQDWAGKDFEATSLEPPLGSGPYLVERVDAGRSITYRRNPEYWGRDLPVNRGRYNFEQIRYDYYRDTTVSLEAFKAGEYDFRQEGNSKLWATAYNSPAVDQGRIRLEEIDHENPTGMQGFVFNTRRPVFANRVVREALAFAFDFEWTNTNLFYGQYTRTRSYFSNSEMAASGLPGADELALLEPFRQQLPAEVFEREYQPPSSDGSGNLRQNLAKASELLSTAGWKVEGGVLKDSNGTAVEFEILLYDPGFERIVGPFIQNLRKLGVQAHIRKVDINQYLSRLREFDFDMIVGSFPQSNSPGNEQRDYWNSRFADQNDSRNLIGIRNPVVDALVEQLIQAPDRQSLVTRARALDRVLQWGHYVIPQWHIRSYRVAYWNKFRRPAVAPKHDLGFMYWWVDADAAAALESGDGGQAEQRDQPETATVDEPAPTLRWFVILAIATLFLGSVVGRAVARRQSGN